MGNTFEKLGNAVNDLAESAKREAEKLAENVRREAEIAAENARREAERLAENVRREAEIAAENARREAEIAAENVRREAAIAAENAKRESEIAAQNLKRETDIAVENAKRETDKAGQNIGKNVEKGVQDVGKTLEKAGQDIGNTINKTSDDTVAQVGRSYGDLVQLAETSYHFLQNQVDGINKSVLDAANRIEEGKLVDAVWHCMTDPARVTEQSAAAAVMESTLLNSLAAAGAAAYGGPAGAAAYAAWYAYKSTNNLEAALRAGVMAWATSYAGKASSKIDANTLDQAAKRVLASAAIGGASVAAAGGTDEQVLAAFGKGAVVGSAREVFTSVTKSELDGKAPTKPPILKLDKDVRQAYGTLDNGEIDITTMPKDISHVGIATATLNGDYFGKLETNGVMQDLAKIPHMNDMAYFHDQWMALTATEGIAVQVTILPAIVLTGAAADNQTGLPTKIIVDDNKKK